MRGAAPLLSASLLALAASAADPFAGAAGGSEVVAEGVVHNVSILADGRVAFDVRGAAAFTAVFEDASMIAPVDFEDAFVSVAGTLARREGAVEILARLTESTSERMRSLSEPMLLTSSILRMVRFLPWRSRMERTSSRIKASGPHPKEVSSTMWRLG